MKYAKNNKNPFYNELKVLIDRYFEETNTDRFGNEKQIIKGGIILGIYLLAYASLFFPEATLQSQLISYLIIGITGVMIVFNIVHDASHHALFKNQKLNNYIRYLGDFVGINTYIWDIRHNIQHHTFTNVLGGDLIIENIPLIRMSPEQPHKKFHKYQLIYTPFLYMFYTLYWIFIIDIKLFLKREICNLKNLNHPVREWLILIFFKFFYVTYIIVLPWLFTSLTLLQVLVLFFIMHLFGGMLLSIVAVLGHFVEGPAFPTAEHGIINNSWSEHELEATIDFAPQSRVVNWITGGLNTHVVHHLFPRMAHIHYFNVTPIIEDYCRQTGYPYRKESLLSAIKSHVRYLKKLSNPG